MKKLFAFLKTPAGSYIRVTMIQRAIGVLVYLVGSGWKLDRHILLYFLVYVAGSLVSSLNLLSATAGTLPAGKLAAPPSGTRRILTAAYIWVGCFVIYFIAGLEARRGVPVAGTVYWAGMVLVILSGSLSALVTRGDVRRSEKDPAVGPYALIRCPGHAATLLWCAGAAMVFATTAAALAAAVTAAVVVTLTALEDRELRRCSKSYYSYACKVKYRLLPPLW